jgi:LysR family nitrogen assimilation transcriptional regulator
VPLLVRHSRGVSPTAAGLILYERALEILGAVDNARQEVIAHGGKERESVILGLTNGTTALLGKNILTDVRDRIPNLQLSLVEEMSVVLIDALERGEIDLAIAYDVGDRPGLSRVPLMEEEVLFVRAASDDSTREPITFADAMQLTLVLPNERDVIRQQVQATADRLAIGVDIGYEVSSITMIKQLVAAGGVASIMPFASVKQEIEAGTLCGRRIVEPVMKRTLYLIRSARRARFVHDRELIDYLGSAILHFASVLGELAKPLESLSGPLSESTDRPASPR